MTVIYGFTHRDAGRAILVSDDLQQNLGQRSRAEKLVRFGDRFVAATYGEQTLDTVLSLVAFHYLNNDERPGQSRLLTDIALTLCQYAPKVMRVIQRTYPGQVEREAYLAQFAPNGVPQGCGMFLLDAQEVTLSRVEFGTVLPTKQLHNPPIVMPLADMVLHHTALGVAHPNSMVLPSELETNVEQLAADLVGLARQAHSRDVGDLGAWADVRDARLELRCVYTSPAQRMQAAP